MKILFAFSDYGYNDERKKHNTYGGVGYYRIIKPSEQVEGHEVKVVGQELSLFGNTLEEQWDNIFKEFDVFWTGYFADDKIAAAIFYYAQKHGKKVVIDCDDNYLDVPESNLLYDTFKRGKKDRAFLTTILSFADAITVSTEPLKERIFNHIKKIHGIEKKIYVLPNMNDLSIWEHPKPERKGVVIGYSGSNSHHDDLKMVLPSLIEVMKRNDNVSIEMIGAIGKKEVSKYFDDIPQKMRNRFGLVPATATFKEYPLWLASQGWDIGIAPLVDTLFTRSKSHIKWLEYSSCKIPTVASRVYPYSMPCGGIETIKDGETGFLVKQNEWVDVLDELVKNESKRKKIGEQAYQYVKDNWQYGKLKQVVKEVLDNL